MDSGITTTIHAFDTAFFVVFAICLALLLLVTVLMLIFVFKYRKSRHPEPKDVKDSLALEITWTVIPIILVMIVFFYGWEGYKEYLFIPDDAFTVNVYGMMWAWQYEYPNGVTTDKLYVPKGKAIKLLIKSRDVLHSFYVPAFRLKQDALPNLQTKMWFEANKTGTYDVFCAEYCGTGHADMLSEVIVMEQEEFNTWYGEMEDKMETGKATPDNTAGSGKETESETPPATQSGTEPETPAEVAT